MRGLAVLGAAALAVALVVILFFAKGGPVINPEKPFKVEGAYARAVGASAMAGAVFMLITNQSGQDDVLVAAKTDASAMAELHRHIETSEGVMMMRQIDGGIPILAGETVVMQRGGDHVMLMGLNDGLDTGETVQITLTFEKAGEVVVRVPVDNER